LGSVIPAPVTRTLRRELSLRDLTLFAVTCMISTRWIPIAAHSGASSVVLWLLATVLFAAPLTAAVGALATKYPAAGGLYLWTRHDFGAWHAFLAFWSYWLGIAFLFPTAALLYARVGFSALGGSYAAMGENRFYLLAATLTLIWIGLGTNLVGLRIGKWTENLGALAGLGVAVLLIAIAWMTWLRRGTATPMDVFPTLGWRTVSFSAAIAFAMSGMEGVGMMAEEIREPERTIRRAGWIATAVTSAFYISATVAFLVVLPSEQISELNGFAETAGAAGLLLGLPWVAPLICILALASGLGLLGGIGSATSRMPFAAGVDHLLPEAFGRVHPRWGTPHVSILVLGVVASFFLVVYQLGDTLRAAFDEMVSLMLLTGFLPFVYLFGSAWKAGKRLSALSGGAVTLLALVCSVIPPEEISNVWLFEIKLAAGTLAVVVSAWLVYRR
jgi:glutamate:GABA antiporter